MFLTSSECKNASKQSIFMQHLEKFNQNKKCIPVGCIPPACSPYLPAWTAQGASALPGGSLLARGVCLARGVLPCQGGSALPGGGFCLAMGDLPCQGGSALPWEVCLARGEVWYPSMHWGKSPPCEQNHRHLWKYNLASTSLRAVKTAIPLNPPPFEKSWIELLSESAWQILSLWQRLSWTLLGAKGFPDIPENKKQHGILRRHC